MISILLIMIVLAPATFATVTPCGEGSNLLSFFEVSGCDPDSLCKIAAGSEVTATAGYISSAQVTSVTITRILKFESGMVLSTARLEGCDYAQCLLESNVMVNVALSFKVPVFVPKGRYILQIELSTDHICFTMLIEIV
ncbi:hypothetical protein PPYR_01393 [Photinus pyralis]|uniref:MD-2-related lipid-recognition domain-containing protein n=1 Tax=Photinus pyralis TaxID=7054 RepID=A0A5N4B4E4_PHOPY|nr:uncharacterized protein LOC116169727 [Photinus pyralis]KAB0804423.1 hypothetical protein PPYR_01393 [Photinus pyralis]